MTIMDLNEREKALIEILRNFEFVKDYGYREYNFLYFARVHPSMSFKNNKLNQILHIIGSDYGSTGNDYSIIIEKRSVFSYKSIDPSDYYKNFKCSLIKGKKYSLKSQVDFIKQHLMPVIKGEMWIDELIKTKSRIQNRTNY
jgi:hypothetical protein